MAIFPFENLTEANGLAIFCKSFWIDLVTELSRFRQFRIIASDSLQDPKRINPDYSIKGSFRYHNDLLRINAQLINSHNNLVVWAERYEGDKNSIFSIQEDLLREVVSSLQQQLNFDLLSHMRKKIPVNLTAYENWLYGMEELKKGSVEADEEARVYFERAIETDPGFSLGYSGMSLTFFNEWSCQLWDRWDVCQKGAFEWAKKAIDLDEQNYVAAFVLGRLHLYQGDYEIAEHYLRRALRLNPNDVDNLINVSSCFVFLGYVTEAEKLYHKVLQLNPLNSSKYNYIGAFIAFEKGEFEKCILLGSQTKSPWVDFGGILAAAYYMLGDFNNMNHNWQVFLNEFQSKILHGREVDNTTAIQWIINVNPYREKTNLRIFWEYIKGSPVSISERVLPAPQTIDSINNFFKEEELWHLSYQGKTIHSTEVKGFYDLATLLENPEQEVHCSMLVGNIVVMNAEPVFDEKAKLSYQKKILELQQEIQWSETNNDLKRTSLLQEELDQIIDHLSASLGLKGKIRKEHDPIEKARSAVTWRIRNAIQKIDKYHPALGRHLSSSINTGLFCSYTPEKSIRWVTQLAEFSL